MSDFYQIFLQRPIAFTLQSHCSPPSCSTNSLLSSLPSSSFFYPKSLVYWAKAKLFSLEIHALCSADPVWCSPSAGRRPGNGSSPSPGAGPLTEAEAACPEMLGGLRLSGPAQPSAPSRPPSQSCSVQAPRSQSARGRTRFPNRGIPAPPWQGLSSDSALPAGEARYCYMYPLREN